MEKKFVGVKLLLSFTFEISESKGVGGMLFVCVGRSKCYLLQV